MPAPGKYVWILRGSHTTRVLSEDRAAVLESVDEQVAKYFAAARGDPVEEAEEPEEEAEEEPEAEAVEAEAVEAEVETSVSPSQSGVSTCGHCPGKILCF